MSKIQIITGLCGLFAALLACLGEYLLSNTLFIGTALKYSATGHFLSVLGTPLYLLGCFHIYIMLKSTHQKAANFTFMMNVAGFLVAAIWSGFEASNNLTNSTDNMGGSWFIAIVTSIQNSVLPSLTEITSLVFSFIFMSICWNGTSLYRWWMVVFSPSLLFIFCVCVFAMFAIPRDLILPVAFNLSFAIFFLLSLLHLTPKTSKQPSEVLVIFS